MSHPSLRRKKPLLEARRLGGGGWGVGGGGQSPPGPARVRAWRVEEAAAKQRAGQPHSGKAPEGIAKCQRRQGRPRRLIENGLNFLFPKKDDTSEIIQGKLCDPPALVPENQPVCTEQHGPEAGGLRQGGLCQRPPPGPPASEPLIRPDPGSPSEARAPGVQAAFSRPPEATPPATAGRRGRCGETHACLGCR